MHRYLILLTLTAFFTLATQWTGPSRADTDKNMQNKIRQTAGFALPLPPEKPEIALLSYAGDMGYYTTKYEDTLLKIARANNLGYVEIRSANPGIDPWLPGEDQNIILPTRHLLPKAARQGVVVNLSEMRLYAFLDHDAPPISYPIGIGRTGLKTPIGSTHIIKKKENPVWFPTPRMREEDPALPAAVKPGPDNPLGTHALYLEWPTFLIHGTSEPWGIGRRVSSGCIRLYPEDIIDFYDQVDTGTQVTIVDQPVKAGWIDGRLFIEAHVSQSHANDVEETGEQPPLDITKDDLALILEEAGEKADLIDWQIVREILSQRRGYPIAVTPPATEMRQASREPSHKSSQPDPQSYALN